MSRFDRLFSHLPGGTGKVDPPAGEVGVDSPSWVAHYEAGGPDVNPVLTGSAKWDVYDEMRKSSTAVKSTLWYVKLPVRSGRWDVEPASEDPVDLYAADLVKHNLGLGDELGWLDLSWDETLQQALQILDWGPWFEELIWGDATTWRDADGNEQLIRPLARLAPRPPSTIQRVKRDKMGAISFVEQLLTSTTDIPGEKLVYMVLEREPGRWDGPSLMRPMWGPWFLQKELMVAAGIAWDRHGGGGLPEIRYPQGKKDEAEDIGRSVRTHERAYMTFESEGGPIEQQAWQFKFHTVTPSDPIPLMREYGHQIAEAGMQQFSRLGTTETGSRAVGDVLVDPFFLAVQSIAKYVARERMRQVARKIIDVNLGQEVEAPRITVSKIQARGVQTITSAIADLATAGFSFADREVQDELRDLLELPRLPNDLADHGVDRAALEARLREIGLEPAQLAQVVAALPEQVGLKANGVPREGAGLGA